MSKPLERKILGRVRIPAVGGGIALLLAASLIANAGNFAFSVVAAHVLPLDTYGALGGCLSLIFVLGVPLGAATLTVTRSVAELVGTRELALRRVTRWTGVASSAGFGLILAFSPLVSTYLHLESIVPALLLGCWFLPSAFGTVAQGALMGQLRYGAVSVALLASAATRLAVGLPLIALGAGLSGALLGSVVGAVVATGLMCWYVRWDLLRKKGVHPQPTARDGLLSVVALVALAGLGTLDVPVARHFLARRVSAYYAAGSTIARLVAHLPGLVAGSVFPLFVRGELARQADKVFTRSLLFVAVLGGSAATAISLAPRQVIGLVYGRAYVAGAGVLIILAWGACLLALLGLGINLLLARRSRTTGSVWVAVAGFLVLSWLSHGSASSIAWEYLISIGAMTVVILGFIAHRARADGGASQDAGSCERD